MKIKIYSDIAGKEEQIFCDFMGINRKPFSAEFVKDLLESNPNETDFYFDIHCNGGNTHEGFTIYDILRTSGKTIHCNIDGGCHSMAIIILLAAPTEYRTANPKATALIHDVRSFHSGDITADDALTLAEDLLLERGRILDVYHERTGYNRQMLENIMLEEKTHTVEELLGWGFISKINNYTNKRTENMSTRKNRNSTKSILDRISNFLRSSKNHVFTDVDGNVLFTTESDKDTLEVGMVATPDGEFALPDGRTILILDGAIIEIIEPDDAVEELQKQLKNANALLDEARNELRRLSNIKSNYKVKPREGIIENGAKQTAEERKNEVRKHLGKK